jgi:hypothetical protein
MNNRLTLLSITLIIALGNFARLTGTENIKPIHYVSLLLIGGIFALLIREVVLKIRAIKKN